jgi:hypothetical protein
MLRPVDSFQTGNDLRSLGSHETLQVLPCEHFRRRCFVPSLGAPYPAREKFDGRGYEYKSKAMLFGLPLLHVAFKYRPNRVPVVARGIIAIGQFACGFVTVSQFGIGVFSLGQIAIAGFALAQIGVAYRLIAQIGLYVDSGHGQLVWSLTKLLGGH